MEEIPAWGQVLRRDVETMQGTIEDIVTAQSGDRKTFGDGLRDLDRALNTRLPVWATFLIGGLMSAVTGLAVAFAKS